MVLSVLSVLSASLFLGGCGPGDPSSQLVGNLSPVWQIDYDSEIRQLKASAKVIDPDVPAPTPTVAIGVLPTGQTNEIRLTGGDRLQIEASGRRWLLYRRDEAFLYQRELILPDDATTFQARLDTKGDRLDPVVATIDTSYAPQPVLAQENLVLTPADALNVSWQSASVAALGAAEDQGSLILVTLESCDDKAIGTVVIESLLAPEVETVDLTTDFSPGLLPDNPMSCAYSIQIKSVMKTLSPAAIEYSVGSRKMVFSVVYP